VVERSDTTGPDVKRQSIPAGCKKSAAIMASTFIALHYHIVFSTKDRAPLIDRLWAARLHCYLGATVGGLDGFTQEIGGVADHVHLLVGLKSTHKLSDFMRELKKASSSWVRDAFALRNFSWQEGYGAFTVSPTARPQVRNYIKNQSNHHRVKSFREELAELLKNAGVDYEDKYLD